MTLPPKNWDGARLCAEHQPQHARISRRVKFFRHGMGCECAAAGPLDTAALPEGFMESLNLQEWTRIGAMKPERGARTLVRRSARCRVWRATPIDSTIQRFNDSTI